MVAKYKAGDEVSHNNVNEFKDVLWFWYRNTRMRCRIGTLGAVPLWCERRVCPAEREGLDIYSTICEKQYFIMKL